MSDLERGVCQVCGQERAVTSEGLLYSHSSDAEARCRGGRLPALGKDIAPGSLLKSLIQTTANLQVHIDARAEEIAAPLIAEVAANADRRIAEVEKRQGFEIQRQTDLVAELRRQLKPLAHVADRLFVRTRQATFTQRREALGLDCDRCEGLIVELEPGSTLTEVMTAYVNHYCQEDNQ